MSLEDTFWLIERFLFFSRGLNGLEIRRLQDFNVSFVFKWWWKLLTNHHSRWVIVVLHNYYCRGRSLDLQDKLLGRVLPFWRGVLKTMNAFKIGLRICCGQGISVKFWKDCWLGEIPLALAFLNLFDMEADKNIWVSSQIQENDWVISFRHPLSPTRLQMLALLVGALQGHTFRDTPDQVIWKVDFSASFIISSQYKLLQPL